MPQAIEGTFNPAFHFLGLIQKAMSDGITRHCVHAGSPEVYLVPAEQIYYTAHPDIKALEALCLAAPFDFSVELAPDWRPDKDQEVRAARMVIHRKVPAEGTEMLGRPLQELLWYAALCGSGGQLLQGCYADTQVSLTSCPDFSHLVHREFDPVLAASLLEKSAALTTVSETTGIPLAQVFEFYNACAALGLIMVEPENVFDPANYLLGLLQKADADRQIRRCELTGHAAIYLVPDEGRYYTEADPAELAKLCAAQLSELEVSIVDNNSGEEEIVQVGRTRIRRKKEPSLPKLPGHPLSELMFHAALYASQGRLLSGYNLNEAVRLKSWPDKALLKEAASIKEERYFFPLAAFMSTKAACLTDIAEATQLPLERVIDFHNACAVADLLEHPS
ncbi:MAG: hypothetical protein PHH59_07295 [Methylovulum sp.]|uniref:hypothetical protein n=1 Tax=Methylovulum sp. TaxID=1916980 RepID=UPI002615E356|nr:hypothetical protein [Methylovulum sp.]MDD2723813.1 hypothetical protein [Methylovulum sp.]MDD5126173.1 hypothetical protein [Methylovulum sp.]